MHSIHSIARVGGGGCAIAPENLTSYHASEISSLLRNATRKSLANVTVEWNTSFGFTQSPVEVSTMFENQRQIIFALLDGPCSHVTVSGILQDKTDISITASCSELSRTRGSLLHCLAARAIIRDWSERCLHEDDDEHFRKKDEMKSRVIALSKKFPKYIRHQTEINRWGFPTELTSFIAIEERLPLESISNTVPPISDVVKI